MRRRCACSASIDAALGRKDEAIREGRRAIELLPITKDSIDGAELVKYMGVIYAWCGEKDLAIEQIAATLKIPSTLSYGNLKLHPVLGSAARRPTFRKNCNRSRTEESVARARFRELVRDSFRQIKKQNAEDDVNGEKLDAFDPVRFAVAADLKQDVNRSDYGEDFRPRKLEVHRLTKQIGDE